MNKLNAITEKYKNLPYMDHPRALYMREIIQKFKCKSLCELGHLHGKSSIYIGSILEEQGFGKLMTYDLRYNSPSIINLIKEFNLEQFVEPIISAEGYVWDLAKLIKEQSIKFDFCYIDGSHTFESTTLGFILIDLLLEPNGIIIFDDLDWSLEKSISIFGNGMLTIPAYKGQTELQKKTPQVKMVCDLIVPKYNYQLLEVVDNFEWAIFQKKISSCS